MQKDVYKNLLSIPGYGIFTTSVFKSTISNIDGFNYDGQIVKFAGLDIETMTSGNFKGIKKGTICRFGQICGGTKNNVWIRDKDNKRIGRAISKIGWLSHNFKTSIPPPIKMSGLLEVT